MLKENNRGLLGYYTKRFKFGKKHIIALLIIYIFIIGTLTVGPVFFYAGSCLLAVFAILALLP